MISLPRSGTNPSFNWENCEIKDADELATMKAQKLLDQASLSHILTFIGAWNTEISG